MMMARRTKPNTQQQGFSMIEVLVSLLVLSIGLLGLVSLQTLGIRYAYNSYQGTQATLLAYDIIDLMRANKVALSAGEFSNVATTDMYTTATDCFASACSPQQLAQHDLRQWKTSIQLNLGPDATGAIVATAANHYTVTINWREQDTPSPLSQNIEVVL